MVDCQAGQAPDGWWTGLSLLGPSDQVATGLLRTDGGYELEIFNGTAHLEENASMARIGPPPCETLLSPFTTLTGVDPLRVDAECID